MKWLQIVGILVIVFGSAYFYWQFQVHMAEVEVAKREASAIGYFTGADREKSARHDALQKREAEQRSAAKNCFFGGVGMVVVGIGLFAAGWYRGRNRGSSPGDLAKGGHA